MAYPTNHKIEEIFQLRDSWDTIPKYREYLADNLIGHVSGYDHELSGDYRGKDAWVQNVEMRVGKMLRKDHPINLEIVNVIGGGESPWACVEMRTKTKSHKGELLMLSRNRQETLLINRLQSLATSFATLSNSTPKA